jgi:hypothetical protein
VICLPLDAYQVLVLLLAQVALPQGHGEMRRLVDVRRVSPGAGLRVLLPAGAAVEDRDAEHGGCVAAEDEHVALPEVVGAGELPPAAAEVQVVAAGDELHVPQRQGASAGEPQLQLPAVSENPRKPRGQPLCAEQSNQELRLAALWLFGTQSNSACGKETHQLFLDHPGE